ncbi:MAG: DNA polymerase III subunit alpha [Phycisphaerae bacterium]|nr:DNA polymerase III subunit alpha [Phycisphaerae bacterium]
MTKGEATTPFAHLHVHTHYSLLDGAVRIDELVRAAKDMGMPAIAITDHGNMFGAIEFYQTAINTGIKPIIGMEAYIAPGDRRSKDAKGMSEASHHLLLLVMNNTGYRNLLKLASIGYCEGFYYRPRIDREVLEAHNEGLICMSACLGGEIPQALIKRDRAAAEDAVDWYLGVFGPERFYLELQDHGMEEQKIINPELIDIANNKGVGLVATNDVHYLTLDDVEAHDVLCCVATRALQSEDDRFRFPSDQFYLKSPAQMKVLFSDQPEAISNAVEIADRCNVELDLTKRYTPVYRPPGRKSAEAYLRELVYKGAAERYGEITDEIRERIDYELDVIQSKGFSSYFLINWDLVQYAQDNDIPCGARGSGCSSIVAYCLYLSQPDPLRYGLYFERFMDPDRDEMPDIDLDICQDGREQIIQYVREKYGHVAQIITFGTLKARAVIRDVCRVLGVSLADADRVAKLVPEELKMTLDKALAQEPELRQLYDEDPTIRKVIDIGKRLEGLARNTSVHAAGVVIADQPLDTLLPLYKPSDSDSIMTQFEGTTVEKVGLLKMDFLGLRTLSVIARACKLIQQHHGVTVDLAGADLADKKIYEMFASGQTKGMFQFESGGMRDVLMKMQPNRIEDLIAANALYRPGPMVNIDAYIARKHGEAWSTPHKTMDEVLAETYGIIVYQEQVARLVNQLGGIERKRAFRLAKAISKKRTEMIEAERGPFVDGAGRNGLTQTAAEEVFNQILPFGEYAFNKAHATGYALVAFQTAWLKTYYPVEFMAALLTYEMGDTDKVVEYIEECKRLGIAVRPPDINTSNEDFTVVRPGGERLTQRRRGAEGPEPEPQASSLRPQAAGLQEDSPAREAFLRFGLAAIKGIGRKAVQCIARAREEGGPFLNLYDFCERVDLSTVNKGVIEALIKAGAFDSTGAMRKALVSVLDKALQVGAETQHDRQCGQMNMFGTFEQDAAAPPPPIPTDEWTEAEMLAHEKSVLGFYVTSHPLAKQADRLSKFATADCADLAELSDATEVVLGGMITRVRNIVTKTGRNAGSKMAALTFEDLTGSIEAVVFSEEYERHRALIRPDKLVFLRGRVDRRREEPSLRVSDVIAIDDGPALLADAVIIRLKSVGLDIRELERLRDVCRAHPGERPIFMRIQSPGNMTTVIRCGADLAVRPDTRFVSEVRALLGDGSMDVVPRRRRTRPSAPAAPAESRSNAPATASSR